MVLPQVLAVLIPDITWLLYVALGGVMITCLVLAVPYVRTLRLGMQLTLTRSEEREILAKPVDKNMRGLDSVGSDDRVLLPNTAAGLTHRRGGMEAPPSPTVAATQHSSGSNDTRTQRPYFITAIRAVYAVCTCVVVFALPGHAFPRHFARGKVYGFSLVRTARICARTYAEGVRACACVACASACSFFSEG